jgi:hypothetical protein
MRQKSGPEKQPAEDAIRDIRRATRRHFSAEEKIRVGLEVAPRRGTSRRGWLAIPITTPAPRVGGRHLERNTEVSPRARRSRPRPIHNERGPCR